MGRLSTLGSIIGDGAVEVQQNPVHDEGHAGYKDDCHDRSDGISRHAPKIGVRRLAAAAERQERGQDDAEHEDQKHDV